VKKKKKTQTIFVIFTSLFNLWYSPCSCLVMCVLLWMIFMLFADIFLPAAVEKLRTGIYSKVNNVKKVALSDSSSKKLLVLTVSQALQSS